MLGSALLASNGPLFDQADLAIAVDAVAFPLPGTSREVIEPAWSGGAGGGLSSSSSSNISSSRSAFHGGSGLPGSGAAGVKGVTGVRLPPRDVLARSSALNTVAVAFSMATGSNYYALLSGVAEARRLVENIRQSSVFGLECALLVAVVQVLGNMVATLPAMLSVFDILWVQWVIVPLISLPFIALEAPEALSEMAPKPLAPVRRRAYIYGALRIFPSAAVATVVYIWVYLSLHRGAYRSGHWLGVRNASLSTDTALPASSSPASYASYSSSPSSSSYYSSSSSPATAALEVAAGATARAMLMLFLVICFCVMSSQRIHRRKSIFSLLRTPGRSGLWPWAAGVALALVLQAVYSALYILGAGQSLATVYALAVNTTGNATTIVNGAASTSSISASAANAANANIAAIAATAGNVTNMSALGNGTAGTAVLEDDAAVVASLVEGGIMATVSMMWLLVLLWPVEILVVEDYLKRRDYARHKQNQKRARLIFDTKLGMYSPR